MLRPRIIPCLLIRDGGLIKTTQFGQDKYVGDPINAVRIFNEKEADELIVLDIDATAHGRDPDYTLISKLSAECRMPLCYGGGVQSVEQFEIIIGLGVEKVSIGAAAVEDERLITEASRRIGSQSVVVVMDVNKTGLLGNYEVLTMNGTKKTGLKPAAFAKRIEDLGAGEIVLNSINRDGTMSGYDMGLIGEVRNMVNIPVTAIGGAGSIEDISKLIQNFGIIGAAAGSMFVFKGKYRAVLIQYPPRSEKDNLISSSIQNEDKSNYKPG